MGWHPRRPKRSHEINRKGLGLTWNNPFAAGGVLVGDDVCLNIETELVKDA